MDWYFLPNILSKLHHAWLFCILKSQGDCSSRIALEKWLYGRSKLVFLADDENLLAKVCKIASDAAA
jgi:hypothetical protein